MGVEIEESLSRDGGIHRHHLKIVLISVVE